MNSKKLSFFLSIIFLNFLSFSSYGLPIAFFPNIAKNHGISAFYVGLIFSMYPVGSFFFSLIVGKMLNLWQKKRVILYSQLLMAFAVIIFGYSYMISSNFLFVLTAMLARTAQGVSIGCYQTAAYAYVPEIWPDEIDLRIGLLEMTVALGIGTGPLIGAFLYSLFNYLAIYIVPGIVIGVFGTFMALFILPNEEKKQNDEKEEETLSIIHCFSVKEIWYCNLSLVINYGAFTLIMPELENKVIELGGSPEDASYGIAFGQVGYALCIVFLMYTKFDKYRFLFFISSIITVLSLLFMGNDCFFFISNRFALIGIVFGLFLIGIITGLVLIPNISENTLILNKIYPEKSLSMKTNMASGIFSGAISIAEFHGPILGGMLSDNFGFSKSCVIYSFIVVAFFLVYSTHGNGFREFLEIFRNFKKKTSDENNDCEMKLIKNSDS